MGKEKEYIYRYIERERERERNERERENLLCVTHLLLTEMNYFHFIP